MITEPSFTVGIEEEYLLVDQESRDLITEAPEDMLPACEQLLEGQVTPEFLQCQIEVGTCICHDLNEARAELTKLRGTVIEQAEQRGLALIAASTHPFADWERQRRTEKARYDTIAQDLQEVVRRLMICGMHVHVALEDPELRVDLMDQATYILPHLLALSTSSPFWHGHDTGLTSYRIAVWNEMPRTGLPEIFDSYGEYQRNVQVLVQAGLIEDSTKIWWDLRPSGRFPTLEMRISDVCTCLDDTLCIAAIYRCWLHMLYRLRRANQRWRRYRPMLIAENRWLAQRHGIDGRLMDFGTGQCVPYQDLMEEVLEMLQPDAEYFGCVPELEHARTILRRGTSAHWQRRTYTSAVESGASKAEALREVVDMLIRETGRGVTQTGGS